MVAIGWPSRQILRKFIDYRNFPVIPFPFQITSDTGTPGVDISPAAGNVVFQNGQASAVIPLEVLQDEVTYYFFCCLNPRGLAWMCVHKNVI